MNKKTGASMRVSDNITSSISLSTPRIPELEGKVKVELFDAKTGELKEEIEGHNIVTNVIANSFASNYCGKLNYDILKPIKDIFYGGILCFENPLTIDANNMYPPTSHDNPVIAHAGQTTYSSADADGTRGLPNDIESGKIPNGYKQVWDFPATQGNGTISALAMTNPDVGDWWIHGQNTYDINIPSYQTANEGGLGIVTRPFMPILCDDTVNRAYAIYVNGTTVTLRVYTDFAQINGVGMFNKPTVENTETDVYTDYTYTITDATRGKVLFYNGNIHILVPKSNRSDITRTIIYVGYDNFSNTKTYAVDDCVWYNGTLYKCIIAVETAGSFTPANWTSITPVSTSSDLGLANVTLSLGDNYSGEQYYLSKTMPVIELTSDGYLPILGNTLIYFINYSNFADIRSVAHSLGTDAPTVFTLTFGKWAVLSSFDEARNNKAVYTDGYVLNSVSGTFNITVSNWWSFSYYSTKQIDSPVRLKRWFYNRSDGAGGGGFTQCDLFKPFLSTVKNLPSSVTKDSTMTMKITYTITEVEEES